MPTLKSAIDSITAMAADARLAAIALSKHHIAFAGDAQCQSVIKRLETILCDFAITIEQVGTSMTPAVIAALDTSR